jgi:hypothetical protein
MSEMGDQRVPMMSTMESVAVGWLATLVMAATVVGMAVTSF